MKYQAKFQDRIKDIQQQRVAIKQLHDAIALAKEAGYTLDQIMDWVNLAVVNWEIEHEQKTDSK